MTNTIYIIRCKLHSKVYIGQTWDTIESRFQQHKSRALRKIGGCIKLENSINKYGSDNFYVEKLDEAYTQEEADRLESYYILQFNSIEDGMNLKGGGSHGLFSDESKKKMSESKTGEKNNRFGITGENHPMFGKKHTDAAKKKISLSQSGDKHWTANGVPDTFKIILKNISRSNAKLTLEKAQEIRKLISLGLKNQDIADQYNVSEATIRFIKQNKIWRS